MPAVGFSVIRLEMFACILLLCVLALLEVTGRHPLRFRDAFSASFDSTVFLDESKLSISGSAQIHQTTIHLGSKKGPCPKRLTVSIVSPLDLSFLFVRSAM